jgi:serine protease Do
MHRKLLLALGAVAVAASAAAAQDVRVFSTPRAGQYSYSTGLDENRAVIGVTTSTGSSRDTLGVLVSSVTPGGPAEKAGVEEGNRIASVNGVNLRLAPVDVGDWDMANAMTRRLTRELGKLKPGDEAELRVYGGGQTRTIRVKTVASDSLYRSNRMTRADRDERAALGVSLGSGSKRDTLGVLIMGLDDDGPAAKAGLEEGNRIAAINGVDLRVSQDDAGDEFISSAKVARLQRELEKVKAGDEVTLRIYAGAGRMRDVRVKTVAASDLPRRRTMIFGGSALPLRAPMAPPMGIEFRRQLEDEINRSGETVRRLAPRAIGGRVSM